MNDLNITIVQTDLFWEDSKKNLAHFSLLLDRITGSTDLILLPETFNTGFSINPPICAETMDGPSVGFLRKKAKEKKAVIMATLLICEEGNCHNRLVCAFPDGSFEIYDKRHLFRLSEEYRIFKEGHQKLIIEVKGWKILPIICYDLRFPVWSKNTWTEGKYGYDLMVCLANWPAIRSHVWKTLLVARAMENQAYVAGVNRIGDDGNAMEHSGDSMAINAKGNLLYVATPGKEELRTVTLSANELKLYRESYTIGMDWDQFTLNSKN